ncbi:restriction endonuclease subunit S [Enterococcus faecalis]|uniref:restriction endonuclease subunit S n=1 Tax=Enterococcus faecalis TaxID=1351 RepID=UPI001144B80F|nr:restriction endonuclease subunit S [Enterococcus faecalis]NSV87515.1 restriction endonuclease subunit S [Enterococcus faecalis]TQB04585.1 restriction endonuclease subunit S [Enterococcus faecalis]
MRDEMKKVPRLRFRGFQEDWELCKFGVTNSYFTDGNYGESYPSADELSDKLNGVPFLRGCNLKNGRLVEEDANYITPEKHAELTSGHLELDDIVVAVRGSLGALGYAGQENVGWNINSQLAIIRTDKSELKGQFLIQYLLSSKGQKELLSRNTGTALKQLPIKQLKDVPVPIPIIDEQDKIGSFFVNLDTTITLHQRKLEQLKEFKKAYLQVMFPEKDERVPKLRFADFEEEWELRKLGDITKISTGKLDANAMVENGKYDFYTSGIKKYRIDVPAFEGPAITIAGNGATVGYMHLADNKFNAYQRTYVLQEFVVDRSFLFSEVGNKLPKKINQEARTGNIPYIVMDMLTELKLSIPQDEAEQSKIGSFFKQIDKTIALHQNKLEQLKDLKTAYLQNMFI